MAHRKSRLEIEHEGLSISADVRTGKLEPEAVADEPEIVRRDAATGQRIERESYDKATGEALPEGYGFRWVNEDGEVVPSEDVELYRVDGEERRFAMHEPTIGDERTVTPVTWIGLDTIGEYLVDRTYEIWGEEWADVKQLFELALHVNDTERVPVVEAVFQPSIYRDWGIVTPDFYDEGFSLIMRVTSERIRPAHVMPRPGTIATGDEWDVEEREEPEPIEQELPFG